MPKWTAAVGVALLLCVTSVAAQSTDVAPRALSPRNASYTIEVALDPESKTLEGHEIVTWRNIQQQPTDELWFHLYWNAWRNDRSTWMREARIRGRHGNTADIEEGDWGWIEVASVRLLDGAEAEPVDLTPTLRFASPDDGNPDDRTVMVASLPRAVLPGETIRVELSWTSKIPRTFARTGFHGDYYFIAHWFPKLAVFEPDGWNCHQFHWGTEFYSDYGVYDVQMTVPGDYVLGATGREIRRREELDGAVTHRYVQQDVHDFTWTASPFFVERTRRFDETGLPPVDVRLLVQPEHLSQADRYLAATSAALEYFGRSYGAYPYGQLTVIDAAYRSGTGGMEYSTLFSCGTRLFNPPGGDAPEGVTIHEAGHQFWHGVVGNNEFEHAWLDEGLDTYSTVKALEAFYPDRVLTRRYLRPPMLRGGFLAARFPEITINRWDVRANRYRTHATSESPSTPTFRHYPGVSAPISYDKTALWLATLERYLGEQTVRSILATFYERFRFGHPSPEDFFAVANEVAGQDLGWFFDQVHRGSERFDYAVSRAESLPAEPGGWVERDGRLTYLDPDASETDENEDGLYRTQVVVRRFGGGQFPVEVKLVFEDGHEHRETWEGTDRWKAIVVVRRGKLDHAEVDPDRVLMLDVDRTNNSRQRERESRFPAAKWGSKWMIWLQDLMAMFTFFV